MKEPRNLPNLEKWKTLNRKIPGWPLLFLTLGLIPFSIYDSKSAETAASHIGRGVELVQKNRYEEAAREFTAALELEPSSPAGHFQLGVCDFALRKWEVARKEFEELHRLLPEAPEPFYFLGRLDLQERHFDQAIATLRRVAEHPPFPDTPFFLGQAYMKQGEGEEALHWFLVASRATPQDFRAFEYLGRVYRQLGRPSESEKAYTTSAKLRRENEEATQQGLACEQDLRTKPLEKAVSTCRELFDAQDAMKLHLLGRLYGNNGFYAQGLEPLKLAAALDPGSYEIQHNLGLTYFRLGKFPEAIGPLEKAVELRPEFSGSNALLGASFLAVGENARALDALRRAHRLNPEEQEVTGMTYRAASAVAKSLFEQQKYSECVTVLREAASLSPKEPEAHALLAEVYARMGQKDNAQEEKHLATQLSH